MYVYQFCLICIREISFLLCTNLLSLLNQLAWSFDQYVISLVNCERIVSSDSMIKLIDPTVKTNLCIIKDMSHWHYRLGLLAMYT
jgi:hypothetical protein